MILIAPSLQKLHFRHLARNGANNNSHCKPSQAIPIEMCFRPANEERGRAQRLNATGCVVHDCATTDGIAVRSYNHRNYGKKMIGLQNSQHIIQCNGNQRK